MSNRVKFLEKLLEDLKSDNDLDDYKSKTLDEFIFKFDNPPDFLNSEKLYSDKDFLSFLISCWFFYQIIIKNGQTNLDNKEVSEQSKNTISNV